MTLHLNLNRKWFDMILSGEKKEEYRSISKHYVSQLFDYKNILKDNERGENDPWFQGMKPRDFFVHSFKNNPKTWLIGYIKEFDTITFSNGYAKDRDQFVIEFNGIGIGGGNPDWGAINGEMYFVLKLGKLISKNF